MFTLIYKGKQVQESINQLSVAKITLKKVVNHLNEALIIRSKNGSIGFCNDLGLRLIRKMSEGLFDNQKALNRYLKRMNSMDFLSGNLYNIEPGDNI